LGTEFPWAKERDKGKNPQAGGKRWVQGLFWNRHVLNSDQQENTLLGNCGVLGQKGFREKRPKRGEDGGSGNEGLGLLSLG